MQHEPIDVDLWPKRKHRHDDRSKHERTVWRKVVPILQSSRHGRIRVVSQTGAAPGPSCVAAGKCPSHVRA
jgi:hypothetical protein